MLTSEGVRVFFCLLETAQYCSGDVYGCFYLFHTLLIANRKSYTTSEHLSIHLSVHPSICATGERSSNECLGQCDSSRRPFITCKIQFDCVHEAQSKVYFYLLQPSVSTGVY